MNNNNSILDRYLELKIEEKKIKSELLKLKKDVIREIAINPYVSSLGVLALSPRRNLSISNKDALIEYMTQEEYNRKSSISLSAIETAANIDELVEKRIIYITITDTVRSIIK